MIDNLDKRIIAALRQRQALAAPQRGISVEHLAAQLDVSSYVCAAAILTLSAEGLLMGVRGPGEVLYSLSPMAHAIRTHASAPSEEAE